MLWEVLELRYAKKEGKKNPHKNKISVLMVKINYREWYY